MEKSTYTAVIALGSNLENPVQQIQNAVAELTKLPEIISLRLSSLYQTEPVGYANQPDFINAVAIIETSVHAMTLLRLLQAVEQQFGRVRSFQNAPRTLDLDIIDFNHEKCNTPELILPHPRAHLRGFVMLPLAEIAPDYVVGDWGAATEIAEQLNSNGIKRLA